ncbi:MAG: ATP-binding protein [Candidatus Shapirobacteria bacterium]
MPNNRLYFTTGLPYSGKTTLTRKLVERFGWEVASVDTIMERENMWREGHPTQDDWNQAYSEAYETIKTKLKAGKNVIFDCGNLPFKERQTARDIAESLGVEAKLIYIKVDEEELKRRRAKNAITKERGQLNDEEMELAWKLWDEVKEGEKPIIYTGNEDMETWIKENL